MKKNKSTKKYRHGIEIKTSKKIKKSDLLRRIELLESMVNGGNLIVKSVEVVDEKSQHGN